MKIGISSSLKHHSPHEWAVQMKKLGLESVVFPVNCCADDRLIAEYADEAEKNDLVIGEVGIWKNAISLDPLERERAIEYSINQLKMADRIKARCCVNVAGSTGARWDGAYAKNFSSETWDSTIRMIQEIIDEAKPQYTYFTIEPMPWMYPTSPEEYVKMLEEVNRDHFGVHMDIINMINCPERYFFPEKFLERCFHLLGKDIKSCHLKDIRLEEDFTFCLRECACGEGSFCIEKYAEFINCVDEDMPVIIEHLETDDQYIKSVAYVQDRLKYYI